MKRFLIALFVAALAAPAAAADYKIDTAHSSVAFKVSHMVVSKTRGAFTDFNGVISLDENDVTKSSVEVTIAVASIDTANEDRDEHLRAADFFDAEKYPAITFKSNGVEKIGGGYIAHGELTMKGVTKKVSIPFEMSGPITDPWGNERIGISTESITIDRQDYGISFSRTMEAGGLVVGNDVIIEIEVEAVKAKTEKAPA